MPRVPQSLPARPPKVPAGLKEDADLRVLLGADILAAPKAAALDPAVLAERRRLHRPAVAAEPGVHKLPGERLPLHGLPGPRHGLRVLQVRAVLGRVLHALQGEVPPRAAVPPRPGVLGDGQARLYPLPPVPGLRGEERGLPPHAVPLRQGVLLRLRLRLPLPDARGGRHPPRAAMNEQYHYWGG
jgi:hypothetical protein